MADKPGPTVHQMTMTSDFEAALKRNSPLEQAPAGTIALLGHPANEIRIVKTARGFWRYVEGGEVVPEEDFRAGVTLPAPDRLSRAFRAGWEAAMIFADYPRDQNERDWDNDDVQQSWLADEVRRHIEGFN